MSTCRTSLHLKEVFKKHQDGTRNTSFCSGTMEKSKSSEDTQVLSSPTLVHFAHMCFTSFAPDTNVLISGFKHADFSGSDLTFQREERLQTQGLFFTFVSPM